MTITTHNGTPMINHDGTPFFIDGIEFLITGTERTEKQYFVTVKNLETNEFKTVEHGLFCERIKERYCPILDEKYKQLKNEKQN